VGPKPAFGVGAPNAPHVETTLRLDEVEAKALARPTGAVYQVGGQAVCGQRLIARAIHCPRRGDGVELECKLRRPNDIASVQQALHQAGANRFGSFVYERRTRSQNRDVLDASQTYRISASSTELDAARAHVAALGADLVPFAARGLVRVRAFGTGAALAKTLDETLARAGLKDVLEPSTPSSRANLTRMRDLWQAAPAKAASYANSDVTRAPTSWMFRAALALAGVDASGGTPQREVYPGHITNVDDKQADAYRALGVHGLVRSTSSADSVVQALRGEGLRSVLERLAHGRVEREQSQESDLNSGGADYVFCRMVTPGAAHVRLSDVDQARYFFALSPAVLGRKDWYAYPTDLFGRAYGASFSQRSYGRPLVDAIDRHGFNRLNEVMVQRGIAADDVGAVLCRDDAARVELLAKLRAAHVTTVGGRPLDRAIVVREHLLDGNGKLISD
jgi:hypothetical protein